MTQERVTRKYVRKLVRCGLTESAALKVLVGLSEEDMKSIVMTYEAKIEYL